MDVLVTLAAITAYRRLGGLSKKHLFLSVLEARSLGSGCQHGRILGKGRLLDLQTATFLLYPHIGREREQASEL